MIADYQNLSSQRLWKIEFLIDQDRSKQRYCVGCQEVDVVPNNEQQVAHPPSTATTVVTDVPAGMSREDLYAMLSQQAVQREQNDIRRTPSPPPRLVEAAQSSSTRSRENVVFLLRYSFINVNYLYFSWSFISRVVTHCPIFQADKLKQHRHRTRMWICS